MPTNSGHDLRAILSIIQGALNTAKLRLTDAYRLVKDKNDARYIIFKKYHEWVKEACSGVETIYEQENLSDQLQVAKDRLSKYTTENKDKDVVVNTYSDDGSNTQ